ncbi:MAG TPA: YiiD C-terminal domain-containing protein [Dongiaceae bacterium]|nr:YiiD C-terminal domain-containing protein [Dongiaceae bacterium]
MSNPSSGLPSNLDFIRHKLRSQVPLIAHMGVDIISWGGRTVVVEAPLAPNLNTHGTAFGGSLYNVAAMTGWSAVHLTLMDAGHTPSVWVVKGEIEYKTPVRGTLRGIATISEDDRLHLISGYENKGRVKVGIDVVIREGDQDAVLFKAVFAAMAQDF